MKKTRMDALDDFAYGVVTIVGGFACLFILLILISLFAPKEIPSVIREFMKNLKGRNI